MKRAEILCPQQFFSLSITFHAFRSQQSLLCIPITLFKFLNYTLQFYHYFINIPKSILSLFCAPISPTIMKTPLREDIWFTLTIVDSWYFHIKYEFYVRAKWLFFPCFLFKVELHITSSSKSIVMKQDLMSILAHLGS